MMTARGECTDWLTLVAVPWCSMRGALRYPAIGSHEKLRNSGRLPASVCVHLLAVCLSLESLRIYLKTSFGWTHADVCTCLGQFNINMYGIQTLSCSNVVM